MNRISVTAYLLCRKPLDHWLFAITEAGSSTDIQTFLLVEVTLQQALESLAVAGLVPGHLVDGVVDGVQVQGLAFLASSNLPAVAPFSASTASAGSSRWSR